MKILSRQHLIILSVVSFGVLGTLLLLAASAAVDGVVSYDLSGENLVEDSNAYQGSFVQFKTKAVDTGGAARNAAVAQFRNNNPAFNLYATVPSEQLPYDKLLGNQVPGGSYMSNDVGDGNKFYGQFRTFCEFSHLAYDDPIVYPGQPGASHLHMFFGNTAVDAFTTVETIGDKGGSTCNGGPLNRSAYWFPALFDAQGRVRVPNEFVAYYKTENANPVAENRYAVMPIGLQMIGNNPNATEPQSISHNNGWSCSTSGLGNSVDGSPYKKPLIPNCANTGAGLQLRVAFPRCWNGKTLTEGSTIYAGSNGCDASNPYVFPTVQVILFWDIRGESTEGWYLSSDRSGGKNLPGGTTFHGDWYGGWNKGVATAWTRGCLDAQWNCQADLLRGSDLLPHSAAEVNFLKASPTFLKDQGKGPIIFNVTSGP